MDALYQGGASRSNIQTKPRLKISNNQIDVHVHALPDRPRGQLPGYADVNDVTPNPAIRLRSSRVPSRLARLQWTRSLRVTAAFD